MIATNVCFLGDLRSRDTQTRCEVQDEEDPEADVEEDDENPDAPLPGPRLTKLLWHVQKMAPSGFPQLVVSVLVRQMKSQRAT